jgi:hypothetical protein
MLLFGARRNKITVGRQMGIITLKSGIATTIFENPKPPGLIPEPLGTYNFSSLTWEQLGTCKEKLRGSGKNVNKSETAS